MKLSRVAEYTIKQFKSQSILRPVGKKKRIFKNLKDKTYNCIKYEISRNKSSKRCDDVYGGNDKNSIERH